jgi:pSer/pThr/pTyr-binding forkhead associated (FHA) protein
MGGGWSFDRQERRQNNATITTIGRVDISGGILTDNRRRSSRLACQARLQAEGRTVVTVSRASRQTFFDEHPELRQR